MTAAHIYLQMRKLLTFLFATLILNAYARHVSSEEAADIAREQLSMLHTNRSHPIPDIVRVHPTLTRSASGNDDPAYYIFNAAQDRGFVIVAADDRLPRIIGYSTKGNFDPDNIPPQLKNILEMYQQEMNNADPAKIHPSWSGNRSEDRQATVLETAEWDQDAPYNALCPVIDGERCFTGCAPTAMAIILKYHNWPERGRGYHNTPCLNGFTNSNEVEFDFNTDFDYSALLNQYDENSSEESKKAVARLMLAAGAASCANYQSGYTVTGTTYLIRGLIYYLRYSPKVTELYLKSSWSDGLLDRGYCRQEIEDSIFTQIQRKLPVLGGTGDHLTVIDGYDSDRLLHINWGWSGYANGFYSIPDAGIAHIIINIEPDRSDIPISQVRMFGSDHTFAASPGTNDIRFPLLNISTENIRKDEPFDCVSGTMYFPTHFKGEYGLAIVDSESQVKEIIWSNPADFGWIDAPNSLNIDVRGIKASIDIQDRDRLQIVTRTDGETEWAHVASTRQVAASVPCNNYTPLFSKINWNISGDAKVASWAYLDGVYHSGSELPEKVLLGSYLSMFMDKSYNLYELDKYDYRIAFGLNNYYRDFFRGPLLSLYLYDQTSNINIDSYSVDEAVDVSVNLDADERLADKLSDKQALRVRELTVSGLLKAEDFDYMDSRLPYLTSLDLKGASIADTIMIPSKFYSGGTLLKRIRLPRNLICLGSYAFLACPIKEVYIPASTENFDYECFGRNPELKDLWVENPLHYYNLSNGAFWESYENCTLHVPAPEVDACRNHFFWSNFKEIVPFTPGVINEINFTKSEVSMYIGDSEQLAVNITPSYFEDEPLKWESSDESVATVDANGLVKGLHPGSATIRATTANDLTAICTLTVDHKSGIDGVHDALQVHVIVEKGAIIVDAPQDLCVEVFSISGQRLAQTRQHRIEGLVHGVYVVRVGGKTFKVVI